MSGVGGKNTTSIDAQETTARMPMPDTGLLDAPISPAMYPATPAMTKPTTNTNGTAKNVNCSEWPASAVARRYSMRRDNVLTCRCAPVPSGVSGVAGRGNR